MNEDVDNTSELAGVNDKIVAEGEAFAATRLKDGSRVQTGTVATMLHNIELYNAGERGQIERELELAIPTLAKIGLFDLFPPEEWASAHNSGRAFRGKLAQEYFVKQQES